MYYILPLATTDPHVRMLNIQGGTEQ